MLFGLNMWARTLGAAVGFAVLLGLESPASAEANPRNKVEQSGAKNKKSHGKKTAQKPAKGKKDEKKADDKKAGKKPAARGKTANKGSHPGRRDQPGHHDKDDKDDKDGDKNDCVREAVELARTSGESIKFALTRCNGKPAEKAVERLSVLLRPYSVPKPGALPDSTKPSGKGLREGEISPGIHLADAGLLSRLQAIATEYPGHKISLVSGYRPGSTGNFHRHAKAVDIRVEGVKLSELATFCRGLVDTGCGYYPNSDFLHIDVRPKGSGHSYWIDAAGPGEAPHLVSSWPLKDKDKDKDDDKPKPAKHVPHDDNTHPDAKKKAGHGIGKTDRDHED